MHICAPTCFTTTGSLRYVARLWSMLCAVAAIAPGMAQPADYPGLNAYYSFVDYDANQLWQPDTGRPAMAPFYHKLQQLILTGSGNLNIVHIGGSHIQADVYTGKMREKLQGLHPGIDAGRGLMFPYRTARTTAPSGYRIEAYGKWDYCRNTQKSKACTLGLTGMSVSTADSTAAMLIVTERRPGGAPAYFNTLKVLHSSDSNYIVMSSDSGAVTVPGIGCTEIHFAQATDSTWVKFVKKNDAPATFTLYGFVASDNLRSGVAYHSVGSNGADIPAFLRCRLLSDHLAHLSPDLVVLSLGTNDTYTKYFKPEVYARNYEKLFEEIQKAAPDAVIMLTVPNDCYMYRKYANKNTAEAEKVILNLAKKHNMPVWNFYRIMGGFDSVPYWLATGMMKTDRIHFTRSGYEYKGELFFEAFMNGFENYLRQHTLIRAGR